MKQSNRKAYLRQYYQTHKDEIKAYRAKWNQENKEAVNAYYRKYYKKHSKEMNAANLKSKVKAEVVLFLDAVDKKL